MITKTKNIAVICADGIGDAIIMQILSHNLIKEGHSVTTFSHHLESFGKWISKGILKKQPESEKDLHSFDLIILQHDNSPKAKWIKKLPKEIYTFYGSHILDKHGPLLENDYVCSLSLTMVENVSKALKKWTGIESQETGLTPLSGLVFQKHPKRILIHTSSTSPYRNWPLHKYQKVISFLKSKGYEITLLEEEGRLCFKTIEELLSHLFESGGFIGNLSGPSHLASSLNIPSIVIGHCHKHLKHWQPGWKKAAIALPPKWVNHFKLTRNHWKLFISESKIIKLINNIFLL